VVKQTSRRQVWGCSYLLYCELCACSCVIYLKNSGWIKSSIWFGNYFYYHLPLVVLHFVCTLQCLSYCASTTYKHLKSEKKCRKACRLQIILGINLMESFFQAIKLANSIIWLLLLFHMLWATSVMIQTSTAMIQTKLSSLQLLVGH